MGPRLRRRVSQSRLRRRREQRRRRRCPRAAFSDGGSSSGSQSCNRSFCCGDAPRGRHPPSRGQHTHAACGWRARWRLWRHARGRWRRRHVHELVAVAAHTVAAATAAAATATPAAPIRQQRSGRRQPEQRRQRRQQQAVQAAVVVLSTATEGSACVTVPCAIRSLIWGSLPVIHRRQWSSGMPRRSSGSQWQWSRRRPQSAAQAAPPTDACQPA